MRLRIDFRVVEVVAPGKEADARSVVFGDEVDASDVLGFFERCARAIRSLFSAAAAPTGNTHVAVQKPMSPAPALSKKTFTLEAEEELRRGIMRGWK